MPAPPRFQDTFDRSLWVQMELRRVGKSFASLARDLGVSRNAVRQAMHTPSSRIEAAISDAIDVPTEKLFPERYAPDGRRRVSSRENIHANVNVHVDGGEAA